MTIHTRVPDYDPPCSEMDAWQEWYAEEHGRAYRHMAASLLEAFGALLICGGAAYVIVSIICRGSW